MNCIFLRIMKKRCVRDECELFGYMLFNSESVM